MHRSCAVAIIGGLIGLALHAAPARAQGAALPWGQASDMVAWETFAQITAPSGNPAAHKVEFETWASDKDIYSTTSPKWPSATAPKTLQVSALGNAFPHGRVHTLAITPSDCKTKSEGGPQDPAAGSFPANGCIGEEVRRNWASFQYIVANNLYTSAGLSAAFAAAFKVDLPADSIEFKGDWVKLADLESWLKIDDSTVRKNYYVSSATDGTGTAEFALVAFHFSTKQIKNWVWSDFEHKMNPGRCDDTGCHDTFGAVVADVAAKSPANQQYGDCDKTPGLQSLLDNAGIDPVWRNYCLKGSQIDFLDAADKPTILGNSVIERINAGVVIPNSSCITCHAYASFNKSGAINTFIFRKPEPKGLVQPERMVNFLGNDFIWGISTIPRSP